MKTKFPWNKKMKQNTVSSNPLFWFVLLLMLLTLIRAFPAFAFQEKTSKNPELPIATIQEHLILTDVQMRLIRPILKEQLESRSENLKIIGHKRILTDRPCGQKCSACKPKSQPDSLVFYPMSECKFTIIFRNKGPNE